MNRAIMCQNTTTLLALADFFDVSLDYLTGRSETRERMP